MQLARAEEISQAALGEVLGGETAGRHHLVIGHVQDLVPQVRIPLPPSRNRRRGVHGEQAASVAGCQSPHLAQDTRLVAHGAPGVGQAHREVERTRERDGGGVRHEETEVWRRVRPVGLGDVLRFVVEADTGSDVLVETDQVAPHAATEIHDATPWRNQTAHHL